MQEPNYNFKVNKLTHFFFLLLFMASPLTAQKWEQIKGKGIEKTYVRSFARDEQFIYMGTTTGLYAYSKSEDKVNKMSALKDRFITAIFSTGKNHLWVGTFEGLFLVDPVADKIKKRYQKIKPQTSVGYSQFGGLSSDHITTIASDGKLLFAGTGKWGINILNLKSEAILPKKITSIDGIPSDSISHITTTPGHILVATKKGAGWKGRWSNFWEEMLEDSGFNGIPITTVALLHNRLFLGTSGDGLVEVPFLNPTEFIKHTVEKTQGLLPSDYILGITTDGDRLWVSTYEGIASYSITEGKWEKEPLFTQQSYDKIFVDGNTVMVGTDGEGCYTRKKKNPEISFSPDLFYEGKKLHIRAAVRADRGIREVKLGQVKFRDADLLDEFRNQGVMLSPANDKGLLYRTIAYLDFSKLNISLGKLWYYDISIEVVDNAGNKNVGSVIYTYDSKKPKINFLRISDQSQIFTKTENYPISGKIQDSSLKSFIYKIGGQAYPIKLNSFNAFKLNLKLNSNLATNRIVFFANDQCFNDNEKAISIILDKDKPKLEKVSSQLFLSKSSPQLKFKYIEEHLKRAVVKDPEKKIPIEANIDPVLKEISVKLPSGQAKKTIELTLFDKANNQNSYKIDITLDDEKPVILLKDNQESFKTDGSEITIQGRVYSSKPVKLIALGEDEGFPIVVDPISKKFTAKLSLKKALNRFQLEASIENGHKSTKTISVISRAYPGAKQAQQQVKQEEAGGDIFAELERLRNRVNQLESQSGDMAVQNQTPGRSKNTRKYSPGTFKRGGSQYNDRPLLQIRDIPIGSNLPKLAEKHLGHAKHLHFITLINANISHKDIIKNRAIIVPNTQLTQWLQASNSKALLQLIRAISYVLFYSGDKNAYQFAKILRNFDQEFNEPVKIYAKNGKVHIEPFTPKNQGAQKMKKKGFIIEKIGKTVYVQIV